MHITGKWDFGDHHHRAKESTRPKKIIEILPMDPKMEGPPLLGEPEGNGQPTTFDEGRLYCPHPGEIWVPLGVACQA